jgi:hypothetical protein
VDLGLKKKLLAFHDEWPLERHPFWQAVLRCELAYEEVIAGEVQHFIRTRAGQILRRAALGESKGGGSAVFSALLKIYLEECTHDSTGPSHLDLIRRLVNLGGVSDSGLEKAIATPGNAAAIALYRDIGSRGAGCHLVGAGAVEYFYCELSPKIFEVYTKNYGMTPEQAETYKIHGPMDKEHAEGAFSALEESVDLHGLEAVEASVRDAFVATSLHYDGMYQAATGTKSYWSGI